METPKQDDSFKLFYRDLKYGSIDDARGDITRRVKYLLDRALLSSEETARQYFNHCLGVAIDVSADYQSFRYLKNPKLTPPTVNQAWESVNRLLRKMTILVDTKNLAFDQVVHDMIILLTNLTVVSSHLTMVKEKYSYHY